MKCPFCQNVETSVLETRLNREENIIRRRRKCDRCERRFTTNERVEYMLPMIVKKDGSRESFDRMKILSGVKKACEKRPVSVQAIEALVDGVERELHEMGEKEVPSSLVGEMVVQGLKNLDEVAYVRFASVYRAFKDLDQFMQELKSLVRSRKAARPAKSAKHRPARAAKA